MPNGFLSTIEVEPVGRWFLSHWERLNCGRGLSISGQDASELSDSESEESEEEDNSFEDNIIYLRSLDPKETKDQDHYKVLGISKLRYKATDEQIKKAYRFKVLRHHPDKRRALGEDIREDDDYFTCITKAFEILGVPSKRRAYDSVDPEFDDHVPDKLSARKTYEKKFFTEFSEVFENNARWSTRTPVPKLGQDETSRDEIEKFYEFWYAFESWREYSYLDEEDKETGSDRDERRWIEKNNRVERNEKKKEEMKRIRSLVDNAYNSDPRVIRFREAEIQEKADKKKAKADAAKARKAEEERIKKEAEEKERAEKVAKELEEKKRVDAEKREKEIQKKALKKERRELKTFTKEHNFFCATSQEGYEDEKVLHMTELDKLCEILSSVELEAINSKLKTVVNDEGAARLVFIEAYNDLNAKLEKGKLETIEKASRGSSKGSVGSSGKGTGDWSSDELALLIKAVNLFPAGTSQRWEVVANFVNQHTKTPSIQRNAKETIAKTKELQSGDFHLSSLKDDANTRAYENLEKQKKKGVDSKVDDAEGTTRFDSAAEVQGVNATPWSAEEQKLLEQALKTYPAALGSERWEKITACLPNRSKKDCMRRYKEIAEIVRAKKAAQAAAKASNK